MNKADRELFTELFSVIVEALDAPAPADHADRGKMESRALGMAHSVSTWLRGDIRDGLDDAGLRSTIKCIQRASSDPLGYVPETPEQAERCTCGSKRRWHKDDGGVEQSTYHRGCQGFTPAASAKGNAA